MGESCGWISFWRICKVVFPLNLFWKRCSRFQRHIFQEFRQQFLTDIICYLCLLIFYQAFFIIINSSCWNFATFFVIWESLVHHAWLEIFAKVLIGKSGSSVPPRVFYNCFISIDSKIRVPLNIVITIHSAILLVTGITLTFIFHIFPSCLSALAISLTSLFILSDVPIAWNCYIYQFWFLWISRWLASWLLIYLSIWVEKSHRIFALIFFTIFWNEESSA